MSDLELPMISLSLRNQLDNFANLKGEQVVASLGMEDEKREYIVVKVIHVDRENQELVALDEEFGDEEGDEQRKFRLPMSNIMTLPNRNDPSSAQDFPPGKAVLAVYPGTFALYKATVVNSQKRKNDEYLLEFDNDEGDDGSLYQRTVPYYHVIELPEGHPF